MDPVSPPAPDVVPPWLRTLRRAVRIDLAPAHRQPKTILVVTATAVALAVSLVVVVLLVHLARAQFPTTRHFSHFRFLDYGTLTIVGVLAACAAWPAVTRLTSAPRWLFLRLAVLVTLVLFIPDAWLFLRQETTAGVGILMAMHVAVATITYNALVRIARVRPAGAGEDLALRPLQLSERLVRRLWSSMAVLVGAELIFGIATIVSVPIRRPNTLVPARGVVEYTAHAGIGVALAIGAVVLLVLSSVGGRIARIGAVLGAIGVALGFAGGVAATFQATRLVGMALMLVGVVLAGIGYMAPSLEAMGKAEAARAAAAREALEREEAARAEAASGNGKAS